MEIRPTSCLPNAKLEGGKYMVSYALFVSFIRRFLLLQLKKTRGPIHFLLQVKASNTLLASEPLAKHTLFKLPRKVSQPVLFSRPRIPHFKSPGAFLWGPMAIPTAVGTSAPPRQRSHA